MLGLALLALAQSVPAPPPAQPLPPAPLPVVFGLQLGAPVTLPECVRDEYWGYRSVQPRNCEEKPNEITPTSGLIDFVPAQMPAILGFNALQTRILDGRLEALYGHTLSDNNAEAIVAELTAKFGPPTSQREDTTSIRGIVLPILHATWVRPGYVVDYRSTSRTHFEYGLLSIETDKGHAYEVERDRAAEVERVPL